MSRLPVGAATGFSRLRRVARGLRFRTEALQRQLASKDSPSRQLTMFGFPIVQSAPLTGSCPHFGLQCATNRSPRRSARLSCQWPRLWPIHGFCPKFVRNVAGLVRPLCRNQGKTWSPHPPQFRTLDRISACFPSNAVAALIRIRTGLVSWCRTTLPIWLTTARPLIDAEQAAVAFIYLAIVINLADTFIDAEPAVISFVYISVLVDPANSLIDA